jgi:hypothetical protein
MVMAVRLVQFTTPEGERRVGVAGEDGATLAVVDGARSVYELASEAIASGETLESVVRSRTGTLLVDYDAVVREKRLLLPFDHPDPHHMVVTGTGLTHLGSADTRDKMHKNVSETEEEKLTDSMKMFRAGLEGGKPATGAVGAQPEWFYKGTGHFLVAPEAALESPGFAEDAGEEPELTGLYMIAPDGTAFRVGFAIGNEFSDHVTERRNYLLLAHSKLRQSSYGPELLVGDLPHDIRGMSRIHRGGHVVWEKPFLTGEANMSHTLANLEHHHFKYVGHRVPGDVHVHYFGTATLSFADGVRTQPGDVFEIEAPGFGRSLRNPIAVLADEGTIAVKAL